MEENFDAGTDAGLENGSDAGTDAGQQTDAGTQENSFAIPEEYAQKEWAKNFDGQTGDDLKANVFKALDEKYSNAPVIPQSAEEYAFNDILKDESGNLQYEYPDEALDFFGNEFKELGLTKEQGQGILKKYTDFEVAEFQKYTNAEELENSINTMFNGNTKQRQTVESLIKEFLPQEDQAFLQKTAPNYTIEMFYKLANGLVNKYGFKEGTQNSNTANGNTMRMTEKDKEAEYNRIVGELEALAKRPHSPEEKQRLQSQLVNLYK